ncbi:hypothetical protein D3OALGA1CA_3219 [Olavius algarvensis associated proteobacterium Delta 3]|nr:hypothetical protein D3OALGB2SA_2786 [Olavius algarvensis associated proteobacterium Delta 3]CAB5130914.1 hypothetical protein D3OALGA1CA_3219 [Olavius algarvensis associated proteobacterium Delta 3]
MKKSEYIDFLKHVPLFSMMQDGDLKRIAGATTEKLYRRGTVIIREGDDDTRLFMILRGKVEIIKNLGTSEERHLRKIGPCHYFGEMALIDNMARSASVVALEETTLLSLERWDLQQEIQQYPTIAMELLKMLSRRIRAIEKWSIRMIEAHLPVCIYCGKVCNDGAAWVPLERYIEDHSGTEFSNSICPDCSSLRFPQFYTAE